MLTQDGIFILFEGFPLWKNMLQTTPLFCAYNLPWSTLGRERAGHTLV